MRKKSQIRLCGTKRDGTHHQLPLIKLNDKFYKCERCLAIVMK
jgi:hypothetical protein